MYQCFMAIHMSIRRLQLLLHAGRVRLSVWAHVWGVVFPTPARLRIHAGRVGGTCFKPPSKEGAMTAAANLRLCKKSVTLFLCFFLLKLHDKGLNYCYHLFSTWRHTLPRGDLSDLRDNCGDGRRSLSIVRVVPRGHLWAMRIFLEATRIDPSWQSPLSVETSHGRRLPL